MRTVTRRYSMVFVLLFIMVLSPTVAASGSFSYSSEAQVLNDLGLYNGVSSTTFDPDLGTALNRETGVVMLLRIFGLEEQALAMTDADTILSKFTDAATISSWAKNQVAYAVKNGLVCGYPDGTFGSKDALLGKAYCTLILRQLGFTPDYHNAPAELADAGGLTAPEASLFSEKCLVKDDLVGISFGSLSAKDLSGGTVIAKLVEDGVVEEAAAVDSGLVEEVVVEPPSYHSSDDSYSPPSAPAISSITAANTGDGEGINVNDTITINFNVATNQPLVAAKSDIDALLNFGNETLGADYSGQWLSPTTLVITVVNATDASIGVGDSITVNDTGNLRTSDQQSIPSVSSLAIEGSFGPSAAPVINCIIAENAGGGPGINANDTITINFNVNTNKPIVAVKSDIDALLDFGNASLGEDYTGQWTSLKTLVITLTNPSGATIAVGSYITINEGGNLKTSDGLSVPSVSWSSIEGSFGPEPE